MLRSILRLFSVGRFLLSFVAWVVAYMIANSIFCKPIWLTPEQWLAGAFVALAYGLGFVKKTSDRLDAAFAKCFKKRSTP